MPCRAVTSKGRFLGRIRKCLRVRTWQAPVPPRGTVGTFSGGQVFCGLDFWGTVSAELDAGWKEASVRNLTPSGCV